MKLLSSNIKQKKISSFIVMHGLAIQFHSSFILALYANIGGVINRKNLMLTLLINIFFINLSHIVLAQTLSASNKLVRVPVSVAKYEKLATISNFVGRVEATEKVDVKPEVSGRLKEIKFKDGSFVDKGDVLFVIDPEKYELEVRQNEALVKVSEASLANENVQLERSKFLAANKAIAQSQYDKQKIDKLTAEAKLEQSKIQLYVSQMKLHQSQVKAPISGRVGRSSTSVGNIEEMMVVR